MTDVIPLGSHVKLKRFPPDSWRASENYGWWVSGHVHYDTGELAYILSHPHGVVTRAEADECEVEL